MMKSISLDFLALMGRPFAARAIAALVNKITPGELAIGPTTLLNPDFKYVMSGGDRRTELQMAARHHANAYRSIA